MSVELLEIPGFPARHAFTLRHRGASSGPYASLNLGDAVGDDPDVVESNRQLVASTFGVELADVRVLRQVHGDRIVDASTPEDAPGPGPSGTQRAWPEADAQVTDDPRCVLAIAVADCLPLLFADPVSGAVGAAHCGWKGTVLRLAGSVVTEMGARYGSRPSDLRVAIGPGIGGDCYQVGEEVLVKFTAAGFSPSVARPDAEGRYRLDLAAANRQVLLEAGVASDRIHIEPSCTHCDSDRFFSYRREGTTGRHWAMIRATAVGSMAHAASTGDHAAPEGTRRVSLGSGTNP